MSYSIDDVVQSVRRVLVTAYPTPWLMSLQREPIVDADRPAIVIEAGEETVSEHRTAIPQGAYTLSAPLSIIVYPSLPPGKGGAREAGQTARRLATATRRLFAEGPPGGAGLGQGADGYIFETGRPASGPMTLPLWDWNDVPLIGTPEERAGREFPHGIVRIESLGANAIQDPDDARRWTVAIDLQLTWRTPGRMPPDAPIVREMPGTIVLPG